MASQYSFAKNNSSSEEEADTQSKFNYEHLPLLQIPSPFQSHSSGSDSPTSPSIAMPTIPRTPLTPFSPGSSLGTEFSYIDLSSQVSDGPTPKTTRGKKYVRKKSGGFKKGQPRPARKVPPPEASPQMKRQKVERPKTPLFSDMRFPVPSGTFKILLASEGKETKLDLSVPSGNTICNMEILSLVFNQLNCTDKLCIGKVKLYQRLLTDGLQRFYLLKCTHCHRILAEFPASLPIGVTAPDSINNSSIRVKGHSEINQRSLLAVHTTSSSWEDFRLTCSLLDIKPPSQTISKSNLDKVMDASKAVVMRSMQYAGDHAYSESLPANYSVPHTRECTVSFDASWHRRGHFSNQGFAAAIDSEFGKVLDYTLYDRVCYSCSKWPESRQESNPDEYADYWSSHKDQCSSNYKGTSQFMESSAAVDIWSRSIERHKLVYGTYIGDGDSSAFKNLVKSDPYKGEVIVRKEECLGHVQKRFKKRLMKKSQGGTHLPERKADQIAHLYALVVVQRRGQSASDIRDGLQILLKHTKEQHDLCPCGEQSWCYYQKQVAVNEADKSYPIPKAREAYLSPKEYERAEEVFKVFASLSFCATITLGKTQNSNESLHNMLWHNSPKSKHVGQKSLVASTALAVLSFNEGSLSYSTVMKELGLKVSHNTLLYLSRRDHLRNLNKDRRVKETHKRRRRQLAAQSSAAESSRRKKEKSVYSSGKFGSELVPSAEEESDTLCSSCTCRTCPLKTTSKRDNWISCQDCEAWYHWACVSIKSKHSVPEFYFCDNCHK